MFREFQRHVAVIGWNKNANPSLLDQNLVCFFFNVSI